MDGEPQTRSTYAVSPGVSHAIVRLAKRQAHVPTGKWLSFLRLLASVPGSDSEYMGLRDVQGIALADWRALGSLLVAVRDREDVSAAFAALTVGAGERADCTEREVRIVCEWEVL